MILITERIKNINTVRRNTGQSGQVRSECLMCTFRASCCSARLFTSTGIGLRRFLCPGQEKKGGGSKVGTACTGGYKGVRAVRPESVTSGGCFEVLRNLEYSIGGKEMFYLTTNSTHFIYG